MISLRRIQAIFVKDWKDLLKNSYMLFTVVFPLLFAAWIGRMEAASEFARLLPINLALVLVGAFLQAAIIAEEKEKNTLRGLLLSPVKPLEIFIGKSLLSAFLTIAVVIGSILISDFQMPSSILLFAVAVLLNMMIYINIGTILGLLSRTVMETSIIGVPILMIFGYGALLKELIDNDFLAMIFDYLPNEKFTLLASLSLKALNSARQQTTFLSCCYGSLPLCCLLY
ncbi:ABC transporter permease [Bacillus smithii]|uniref:ABC transporter permease n=1 Tax=Bacillus smithii TaxID=1479 RepID=UPI003D206294